MVWDEEAERDFAERMGLDPDEWIAYVDAYADHRPVPVVHLADERPGRPGAGG